jgi:hypothetical protein
MALGIPASHATPQFKDCGENKRRMTSNHIAVNVTKRIKSTDWLMVKNITMLTKINGDINVGQVN